MHVLVAGATGCLGREMVAELRRRGHRVRALTRDAARAPEADEVAVADAASDPLDDAVAGVDAVFSALGGSSRFDRGPRRPFAELDTVPNLRLLEAAERAGVERFAYVAVLKGRELRHNPYNGAHEDVVDALRASTLEATIIRANGFFSAYDEMLDMALKGRLRVNGDPDRRSNPIHDAELAAACADALEQGVDEVEIGGPETLTRGEEVAAALRAAGREPKVKRVPPRVARGLAAGIKPFNPRRAAVLSFLVDICEVDMVAPAHGTRRLEDYLAARATSLRVRE